jgi:hypothetical protein
LRHVTLHQLCFLGQSGSHATPACPRQGHPAPDTRRCGEALERAGSGVTATACRGCGPRAALQERMKPPGHKFARALRLIFFPGWLRARGGYDVWRWISLPRGKQEIRCDLDGYRRIPVPVFQICRVIGHDWMRRSNTMSCVEEVSLRDHSA